MEFMLLFVERKGAPGGTAGGPEAMKAFAAKLARDGTLRRGAPLAVESAAARVRLHDREPIVRDGPFAESKEVVGGFWIVEAASREDAIDIAARCPHAGRGIVEVHRVQWRDAVADPGNGTPFLFAFRHEPGLTDPDGAKMREMIEFGNALKRDGKFVETAPLARDPVPVRVERRDAKTMVTDGPFTEAKELVGGYALVRAADRAEAVALAGRYPHARWGTVEVREIAFFDRTGVER